MQVLSATIGIALVVGCIAAALVWRWPSLAAPTASPGAIRRGAASHRSIARVLWSRVDAVRVGGVALGAVLVAGIVGGAIFGVLAWMVRAAVGLARYDLGTARWAARNASSVSTDVLRALTGIGSTWGLITVALVTVCVVWRRFPVRTLILFLVVVMTGESLLVSAIKSMVGRLRPDIDRLTGFSGSSFPSGHAAASAAALAAVALLLGHGRSRRVHILLAGVAAGLAAAIAASRVFLGVHWLTDAVAGLVLGWTWFAVVSIGFGGRLLRLGEPVEEVQAVVAGSVDRDSGPTGLGAVT
jgi:membrane-associated phospholipid phosphatase